jgi:hypothetical protein
LFAKLSKNQLDRDAETLKLLLEEGQA